MKKLTLGLVTTVALLTAAPAAMAQVGFYAGPGGVDVQLGGPHYYRYYNGYPYGGYYDYYGGPGVTVGVGPGWHGGWHHDYHHHWHR